MQRAGVDHICASPQMADIRVCDYWSTAPLLHGLWAQSFLSRDRFHALLAFLHVDDPRTEEGRLVCNW